MNAMLFIGIAVIVLVVIACLLTVLALFGGQKESTNFVPARYIATQTGFKYLGGKQIRPTLNEKQYR